ncbi:hypothetical protein HY968_02205 [Candidatus Kaiserbacteria bacterium]|nr:hypothetical protein [Candidatus Kaiserbacteria bacterium]
MSNEAPKGPDFDGMIKGLENKAREMLRELKRVKDQVDALPDDERSQFWSKLNKRAEGNLVIGSVSDWFDQVENLDE